MIFNGFLFTLRILMQELLLVKTLKNNFTTTLFKEDSS